MRQLKIYYREKHTECNSSSIMYEPVSEGLIPGLDF